MTKPEQKPVCWVCGEEAWYWIDCQWSIFDFDQYEVCLDHLSVMCHRLERRTVDGNEPLIYTHTLPVLGWVDVK
jgi:hypothetical protein